MPQYIIQGSAPNLWNIHEFFVPRWCLCWVEVGVGKGKKVKGEKGGLTGRENSCPPFEMVSGVATLATPVVGLIWVMVDAPAAAADGRVTSVDACPGPCQQIRE